ncbi:MAG: HupE/UreJ family protein [Pseudomonadota bacterium]
MRKFAYLVLLAIPSIVMAHEDHSVEGVGFVVGLLHPILGFDHFLAMISVGIISYQIGGKAIWYVPATFVGVMVLGGIAGLADIGLPLVESGIALSVLVLGLAIAANLKLSPMISLAFVAFFAIFHGYAHGLEMPEIASPYMYSLGFMMGTAVIHLLGVGVGGLASRFEDGPQVLRYVGAGIAGIGLHVLVGA